jgi:hypothetical protein
MEVRVRALADLTDGVSELAGGSTVLVRAGLCRIASASTCVPLRFIVRPQEIPGSRWHVS